MTEEFAPGVPDRRTEAGLASVPHSGELLGPDHVRTHAGLPPAHPARARSAPQVEDPDLLARVVDAGIALEVCPTSNVVARRLPDAGGVCRSPGWCRPGARLALGADDPLLFGPRLAAQYHAARRGHAVWTTRRWPPTWPGSSIRGLARAPGDVRERTAFPTSSSGWADPGPLPNRCGMADLRCHCCATWPPPGR